jgi:cation/acetate symporter
MTDNVQFLPLLIVVAIVTSFLLAGLRTKARTFGEYGVGGRYTGRVGGGAAIASNWMSAASFMGMAGLLYLNGYQALAYVIGWTGGYVLLLVLMAGQIRRFGKYTAPDFVGDRYQSSAARLISALISITISVIYCIAQFKGIGMVFAWLFATSYRNGVVIGGAAVVSYLVVAGMLGVTRNPRMLYFVIIISFIAPLMALAYKMGYFWIFPQFGYGEAMGQLSREFGFDLARPLDPQGLFRWVALCFTLMVGTAGLPHVLSRFYIVPNVRDARWSLVWGLFFIALIYWSAPAYAVFGRLLEAKSGGIAVGEAARQGADMAVLTTAIRGGLPGFFVGLLAAGAVSAAFSTVTGLLMTGAASFSHDIYFRILNPAATERSKMAIAKGFTLVIAAVVTWLALDPPGLIAEITALAFALAGNTIFPAFLLGIWWGRANRHGVIAGMLVGIWITFLPFIVPGWGLFLPFTSTALIGAPLSILVMIVVSLLTPPPPEQVRRFLSEEVHGHLD